MPNFLFWKKRNNKEKGALNPLGWSEIRKIEIHLTPNLHEPEYARTVFYPNSNILDPYLTRPPKLTDLVEMVKFGKQ